MINGSKNVQNSIRWGMVGGGKGSNIGYIHRSAALRDNNFVLVAGALDIDTERGKAFGEELGIDSERCYADYQTMFEEENKREDGIQAVSIATPNWTHYTITKAALEAGLHVVCEKPLTFTLKEAEELEAIAKEKKRILGVTYGYSGHQLIRQARAMVERGDLGEIRIVNVEFSHGGFAQAIEKEVPAVKWRFDPEKGGPVGVIGDVGTHAFHLAETIVPGLEVERLLSVNNRYVEGRVLEDDANVMIKYKGRISGHLWASCVNIGSLSGLRIRVMGSKASLSWWAERPNQMTYEVDGEPIRTLERGAGYLYEEALYEDRIGAGHAVGLFESWSNIYRRFAKVMEAADNGDWDTVKNTWYPNVHEGATGIKFSEKCVESADKGSVWVDFD